MKPTCLVEVSWFFRSSKKRAKTDQTNMVAYVVWAINFKFDLTSEIWPLRLFGGHYWPQNNIQKSSRSSPKILINHQKIKFSISIHVSRRSIGYKPCFGNRLYRTHYLEVVISRRPESNAVLLVHVWRLELSEAFPYNLSIVGTLFKESNLNFKMQF